MSTFKVGEVCIMQNCVRIENEGRECLIIGAPKIRLVDGAPKLYYVTQTSDGAIWGSQSHQLRKKRPPTTGEESILALFRQNQREGVAA